MFDWFLWSLFLYEGVHYWLQILKPSFFSFCHDFHKSLSLGIKFCFFRSSLWWAILERRKAGIPLTNLTKSQFGTCPKARPWFPLAYMTWSSVKHQVWTKEIQNLTKYSKHEKRLVPLVFFSYLFFLFKRLASFQCCPEFEEISVVIHAFFKK